VLQLAPYCKIFTIFQFHRNAFCILIFLLLGYCARFIGNSKLKWVDVKMQIIIWARHFIHIKCNWSTIISLRIYVLHPGNIKIVYAISFVTLPFHIYCFGFEIKIEDVCTRRRKRICSHDKSCNKLMQRGKQLNLFLRNATSTKIYV